MIRIGPAGWHYKDWQGLVYPNPEPRGFRELAHLASLFDVVEINTSFYGPPRPAAIKSWIGQVADNPRFQFTAKLWKGFTHERNATQKDEREVKEGMAALAESGRFGALLVQFPWSFKNEEANRVYLFGLLDRFREFPEVIEVRHASWNQPAIYDSLAARGVGICNIDQPLFKRSLRPGTQVTSGVGYVRLHGRNYEHWFSPKATVRERYDYLYSMKELEPWAERTKVIATQAQETYTIANNHNLGKAVVNAAALEVLLGQPAPRLPAALIERYPEFRGLVTNPTDADSSAG